MARAMMSIIKDIDLNFMTLMMSWKTLMKDHDPHIYTEINEFRCLDIIDYHAQPLHIGLGGDSHIEEGGTHSCKWSLPSPTTNRPASQKLSP